MDIPLIRSYEEQAIDTVVSVLNRAKEALGERQTLKQLATTRDTVAPQGKVILTSLKCPIPVTSENLIRNTIEKKWKLTETFMYHLKYVSRSTDECSQYYYFEAIFSQPTALYPIPQATVSVFFRVEDKQIYPPEMTFRIEGHRWDHDVRHVLLTSESLLAVIQMKMKFYRRIEELQLF
ncbi:uncharacterized protein LOC123875763 isoform X2 [Maniola jurtina]|uniref:uncharacterized protein LOC123875763 isoform X2 n=1 Tax=Maniola jurtina TaxID=191418 RepID=UPI001E68D161|nr:uncharacterized protein LOC123875763 isoform X2 [Maniola jurtina]